jgi:hypothetical protein
MPAKTCRISLLIALATAGACGDIPTSGPTATTRDSLGKQAAMEAIVVSTSTSGAYHESDNYSVLVDSRPRGTIGPNGQLMVRGLTSLPHFVELTGLRGGCVVTDLHPKRVPTTKGVVGVAPFSILCGSGPSTIRVRAHTQSYVGIFDRGYTVVLDGDVRQHIASDGTVFFLDVLPGIHAVELIDLQSGCGFLQSRSYFTRAVNAREGVEAMVYFSVLCVG